MGKSMISRIIYIYKRVLDSFFQLIEIIIIFLKKLNVLDKFYLFLIVINDRIVNVKLLFSGIPARIEFLKALQKHYFGNKKWIHLHKEDIGNLRVMFNQSQDCLVCI